MAGRLACSTSWITFIAETADVAPAAHGGLNYTA